MEALNQLFAFLGKFFDWFYIVNPWEQAIHVKRGKKIILRQKGFYIKVPFIDSIFIQTVREKMIDVPIQTVSTKDGKVITVISSIKYTIGDMFKLYNTLSHPEMTLCSMVMSDIATFIMERNAEDLTPEKVQKYVNRKIKSVDYGLKNISIRITTWANVNTMRLIADGSGMFDGLDMTEKGKEFETTE